MNIRQVRIGKAPGTVPAHMLIKAGFLSVCAVSQLLSGYDVICDWFCSLSRTKLINSIRTQLEFAPGLG